MTPARVLRTERRRALGLRAERTFNERAGLGLGLLGLGRCAAQPARAVAAAVVPAPSNISLEPTTFPIGKRQQQLLTSRYYQRMEPLPEVQFAINRYVDYLRKCTSPFWLFVAFKIDV